jgi:hypothetical protein
MLHAQKARRLPFESTRPKDVGFLFAKKKRVYQNRGAE